MNPNEARRILHFETLDDQGAYVRLRLGEHPGTERIKKLRQALRVLWMSLKPNETIDRDIAYYCGIIIHFSEECARNLSKGAGSADPQLQLWVDDLAQGAFDVLAGSSADSWAVARPDLDT